MRKHHSWWVALLGAGALTACGTAVPAAADDREPAWPKVERGESDYSLDGFTVGPLPEGLERHTVKAASSSDREGNRRSEITWVQGSDDLAGHVAVLRADRIQDLEDLREERFGHLRTDGLERLGEGEGFREDAYVSEDTGHLFWVERPGVGVATHLDPQTWDREDLVELAGSVTGIEDGEDTGGEAGEAAEGTGSSDAEADEPGETADAEGVEATEEGAGADAEAGAETTESVDGADSDAAVATGDADSPAEDQEAAEAAPPEEETAVEGADEAAEEAAGNEEADAGEADADETPVTDDAAQEGDAAEADATEDADAGTGAAEEAGSQDTAPTGTDADTDAAQEGDAVRAAEDDRSEQDDRPADIGDSASEHAEQPGAETGDAAGGSALAEGVSFPDGSGAQGAPAFHQCVVDRFDGRTGLNADREGVTEEARAFVERTLDNGELTDGERDRFLANAWFHGSEADKLRAAEGCAEDEQAGGERAAEHATGGASEVVTELDAQARTAFEQVRYGNGAAGTGTGSAVEPIGAQEWQRVQERLPYSLPSDGS